MILTVKLETGNRCFGCPAFHMMETLDYSGISFRMRCKHYGKYLEMHAESSAFAAPEYIAEAVRLKRCIEENGDR